MRKTILFAIAAIFISSCAVKIPKPESVPAITESYVIDYSRFGDFYITEFVNVNFDYKPIARVTAIHSEGYDVTTETKTFAKQGLDDVYNLSIAEKAEILNVKIIPAEINKALDEIVRRSKELGANGILNLTINYRGNYLNGEPDLSGYSITGMAILK